MYNTLYWGIFIVIVILIGHIVYKSFCSLDIWNWLLSIIVDAGTIVGYFVFFHKKTHKYVSRETIINSIMKKQ